MHWTENWMRNLEAFLHRHRGPVLMLSAIFVFGVIFGGLAVSSLDPRNKQELVTYLSGTIERMAAPPDGAGTMILKLVLPTKLKLLALLWVFGISVVGMLGVMVLTLLRGFLTGFVVALLAAEMGGRGVLLAAAGHLPQSLIEVPALIIAGTASVAFSLQLVRSWREGRRVRNFYPALAAYTGTLLTMGLVLIGTSLVESYLSPVLSRFVASFW